MATPASASPPATARPGRLGPAYAKLCNPASMSIVPAIVSREPARLERANGRLAAAQTAGWHLLGPPAGGVLFSLARPVPVVADAVSFAISSAVIATIPGRFAATPPGTAAAARSASSGGGLRAQIREG